MTEHNGSDTMLAAWLAAKTPAAAPDALVEGTLAQTARVRPWPLWRAMLSVPVMRTQSTLLVGSPMLRLLRVAIVVLLLGALMAGAAFVGARLVDTRVPFGRPQTIFFATSTPADATAPQLASWYLYETTPDFSAAPRLIALGKPGRSGNQISLPGISNDGRFIAYDEGTGSSDCRVVVLGTAEDARVESPVGDYYLDGPLYAWAPTGSRIAVSSAVACGDPDLAVLDADTGSREALLSAFENYDGEPPDKAALAALAWWPDGESLLVALDHRWGSWKECNGYLSVGWHSNAACDRKVRLFRVPLGDSGMQGLRLIADLGNAWRPPMNASLSPDGAEVAFDWQAGDGDKVVSDNISVARTDDSGEDLLTFTGSSPAWSPTGEQIVYITETDAWPAFHVSVIDADGTDRLEVAITDGLPEALFTRPDWTPDGRRIYWSDSTGTWTVRPDGADLTRLPLPASIALDWRWSP